MKRNNISERITIVASFTIEPILPALKYWKAMLGFDLDVEVAPYNQIFQELLVPNSIFNTNKSGLNAIFLRADDWLDDTKSSVDNADFLEKTTNDFLDAVKKYNTNNKTPTLILLCPSSDDNKALSNVELLSTINTKIINAIESINNVDILLVADEHAAFRVENFVDPVREKLGDIPYVPDYYHVLGSLVMRRYYGIINRSAKVVVVDCDNTLWDGVCGEVGFLGVSVSEEFLSMQSFLVDLSEKGVLICLASKNSEQDVWDVFEKNPNMILRKQHIVEAKINWEVKSANIREMSESLNLGLDSFIFLDDNPVECAEVRANCPEVTTLLFPPLKEDVDALLHHGWIFDRYSVTNEDAKRTQLYQDNKKRNSLENNSIDFSSFLQDLQLNISITALAEENKERVSQLTYRTNQFNFTTKRRSVQDVTRLLESDDYHCLVVEVSDKFGSYGLVGVIFYQTLKDAIEIDTFLLSCRVLGRGVEYKMLNKVGEIATNQQFEHVVIPFLPSQKNEPALKFLNSLDENVTIDGDRFTFDSNDLSQVALSLSENEPKNDIKSHSINETPIGSVSKRKIEDDLIHIVSISKDVKSLSEAIALGHSHSVKNTDTHISPKQASASNTISRQLIIDLFAKCLCVNSSQINLNEDFDVYGLGSYEILNIMAELLKYFDDLPTTLLFEHRNLQSVLDYLLIDEQDQEKKQGASNTFVDIESAKSDLSEEDDNDDVAIIGVHGRYPQADNTRELWDNLHSGKNNTTPIPQERWKNQEFLSSDDLSGVCGGFLENVDQFDSVFFNISPKEAELMDPQQRLFLEVVWGLVEDAGYTRKTIEKNTGVFVGVLSSDYNVYASEAALEGVNAYRLSEYYQIPNRISYFFDFSGPSLAIDTACSASGTAIHMACEGIKRGDCTTAIAGGVNLILHPSRLLQYREMHILGKAEVCQPFGQGSEGTLMGEGIGAVLLKKLSDAKRDGDQIYGVIKSTAINSGGKTNGFTVPNPTAQASLVKAALEKAKIDPRTISYVEAHGTGTPLGDPIEIRGLSSAFQSSGKNNPDNAFQYCSIGSIKSNIGHLESCAAISGITKVLLQMKHKRLVPSLHSKKLNTYIDFKKTPFFVQQELSTWKTPVTTIDSEVIEHPRRAGISSFGAGGSNFHGIIEEFVDDRAISAYSGPYLFVLSAKNLSQLNINAENFYHFFIDSEKYDALNHSDLSYTLQIGREAMAARLAIVFDNVEDLSDKLNGYINDKTTEGVFSGNTKDVPASVAPLVKGELGKPIFEKLTTDKDLHQLAGFWVLGANVDWDLLYEKEKPKRISLPSYIFAKKRYWISYNTQSRAKAGDGANLWQKQFAVTMSDDEIFLKSYQIANVKIVHNMALLEMVHLAIDTVLGAAEDEVSICFTDVQWHGNLDAINIKQAIDINLYGKPNGYIAYKVMADVPGAQASVYCQGLVHYETTSNKASWNMDSTLNKMDKGELDAEASYQIFRSLGVDYEPSQRVINKISRAEHQLLVELQLPKTVGASGDEYLLNSTAVSSTIDAIASLTATVATVSTLEKLEIIAPFSEKIYAHIYKDNGTVQSTVTALDDEQWHVDIYDTYGALCMRLRGIALAAFSIENLKSHNTANTFIFTPRWKEKAVMPAPVSIASKHQVVLYGFDAVKEERLNTAVFNRFVAKKENTTENFECFLLQLFELIQSVLSHKVKDNILFQVIIPTNDDQQLLLAVSGLIKTAAMENPKFSGQVIGVDQYASEKTIVKIIKDNAQSPNDSIVFYKDASRFVQEFEDVPKVKNPPIPWKEKGVYWITGGLGGLGLLFAKDIVKKSKDVTLVLTGRSALSVEKEKEINQLEALGAVVVYQQLDIGNNTAVQATVNFIEESFGQLNGILHCAGLIEDNFLLNKKIPEFQQVLAPKVTGLFNIDAATQSMALDLFVLFSSISSLGNVGQADYASANAFMNHFSDYRNQQVSSKERSGRTVSINWPFWQDGGMSVDEATKQYLDNMGLSALDTESGIDAFYQSLALKNAQTLVIKGCKDDIYKNLLMPSFDEVSPHQVISEDLKPKNIKEKTLRKLTLLFSEEIKLPVTDIEVDVSFKDYGIDSILITHLNRQLDSIFGRISKTLFYEYQNLQSLSDFLVDEYSQECAQWIGLRQQAVPALEK